jgi:hypothetical protein
VLLKGELGWQTSDRDHQNLEKLLLGLKAVNLSPETTALERQPKDAAMG